MPDIDKLKAQQEKVKTEIRQLENRQKILLNRKTDAERKAKTRRLIEHGAVLESICPRQVTPARLCARTGTVYKCAVGFLRLKYLPCHYRHDRRGSQSIFIRYFPPAGSHAATEKQA